MFGSQPVNVSATALGSRSSDVAVENIRRISVCQARNKLTEVSPEGWAVPGLLKAITGVFDFLPPTLSRVSREGLFAVSSGNLTLPRVICHAICPILHEAPVGSGKAVKMQSQADQSFSPFHRYVLVA